MIVKNATWDTLNLGPTAELWLEGDEAPQDVTPEKWEGFRYVSANLPVGNPAMVHHFEELGFRFMEVKLSLSLNPRTLGTVPVAALGLAKKSSVSTIARREDLDPILREVKGGLFNTDRIALDPAYGIEVAGLRYANWIVSSFDRRETVIQVITYKKQEVGFFYAATSDNTLELKLGGIYPAHRDSGLGILLIHHPVQFALANGLDLIHTAISSNNPPIWRLYESFGYKIVDTRYILRKIGNESATR